MFLNGGDALSGLGDAEGEHGMHMGAGLGFGAKAGSRSLGFW